MVAGLQRSVSRVVPALIAAVAALCTVAACSPSGGADQGAEAEAAALPPTTEPPLDTATTVPETVAPTTEATTTTAAPTTTTTTTTVAPPPVPEGPQNIEPIAAAAPLSAVGSRSGDETARVQQRLLDLGFWLSGVDGGYGLTTRQAVMAFQKYAGIPASGEVDDATAMILTGMTEQAHGTADAGTLVEIDKQRQLLFFIVDGYTHWIFNTSTGNGQEYEEVDQNSPGESIKGVSITPDGLHQVNRERVEGWWEGDLGEIYRPKYFVGGVAVHGSNSVPNYPASHGCVRVTVEAMDFIWDSGIMPMNIPVWVHGEEPV